MFGEMRMNMQRRHFVRIALGSTAMVSLSGCGLGNLAGMAGRGGGGDWSSIANSFRNVLDKAVEGVAATQESLAMLADALGLKQEAAVMRGEAENIKSKGTSFAASELEETTNKTADTQSRITEKLAQAQSLNAQEKAEIGKALVNYAPAAVMLALAAVDAASAIGDASSAGTPSIQDGIELVNLATEIPVKGPAIIQFAKLSVQGFKDLSAIAKENDIAVPATDDMPDLGKL
jgi:hypothetical protein